MTRNQRHRAFVFVVFLGILFHAGPVFAQVLPSAWYFEIDGDDEAIIADTLPRGSHPYDADEVIDGGYTAGHAGHARVHELAALQRCSLHGDQRVHGVV